MLRAFKGLRNTGETSPAPPSLKVEPEHLGCWVPPVSKLDSCDFHVAVAADMGQRLAVSTVPVTRNRME